MKEEMILDFKYIKIIEKFMSLTTRAGLISPSIEDIQYFLKGVRRLTFQSIHMKQATKEAVEESGILSEKLNNAKKCMIIITSGKAATLTDLDTILSSMSHFHQCDYIVATIYDENQKGFQVDILLIED